MGGAGFHLILRQHWDRCSNGVILSSVCFLSDAGVGNEYVNGGVTIKRLVSEGDT